MDRRIHLVTRTMQTDSTWSLDKLNSFAASMNLSGSRLRHLFKEECGVPPSRYWKLLQLRKARSLLEESFLSVKQVMADVGLNDLSHAVRDYKALYGLTPSQTRAARVRSFNGLQEGAQKSASQ